MNDSLKSYVEKITDLPSLPVIAHQILSLDNDNLVSVNRLEEIIENDPVISAKILSVANSAFYVSNSPSKTLNTAIARIGFDSVRSIALGISIMTIFHDGRHQGTSDYERIFNHSVAVGLMAKLLSKIFKLNITDEIVINGMLHDVGLLILCKYFPDRFVDVLNAFDKEKTLMDAEQEVFNFNHSDIGRWLADKWKLPETVSDVILYHHAPSLAVNNQLHVATVHVADYLVDRNVIRATSQGYIPPFDDSCLGVLGMSRDDLNGVITEVRNGSFFNELFTADLS